MSDDERRLRETYRTVFGTVHGQAVLKDLREEYYDATHLASPGDPHATTCQAAQRDVVRYILDMIGLPD